MGRTERIRQGDNLVGVPRHEIEDKCDCRLRRHQRRHRKRSPMHDNEHVL